MMRNFTRYIIFALPIIFLGVNITAQELTQEEKLTQKKEIRRLLKDCVSQYQIENYDAVNTKADSILILEEDNADALYYKSLSYYNVGDTTTAIETLRRGVDLSPLSSRLKILFSRILLTLNNTTEAMSLVDEVLAIKPKLPEALYLKGLVLLAQNDSTQAIVFFQQALKNQIFSD